MDKGTGISFDALFINASMGIVVADERGRIVLVNPFVLDQFGYSENEILGEPVEKLIPSRFHDRHVNHVKHYNQHPKSRPMGLGLDLFAMRKDGTEFPVEVSLGNYEVKGTKFVIAFLSDISKRKTAEQGLKQLNEELENKVEERTRSLKSTVKQLAQLVAETEAKDEELNRVNNFLNNIWAHAEAIIFVTDNNGIIKMFNPAAEKALGFTADEVVNILTPLAFINDGKGQPLTQNAPGSFLEIAHRHRSENNNEYEASYIRKNKTILPVEFTLSPMRNSYGEIDGYIGIASDISERKKGEQDLRAALEKEKDLSELKSRFVSLASHEFRTPLSTIASSAYLISQYPNAEDHPKREKHVQRIVSSVNMLTDILNDFLSVGKIEEGRIQLRKSQFDINLLAQDTINELSGILKDGQSVRHLHEGKSFVLLDANLVKHIIINLLSNAIKFSPAASTIELLSKQTEHHIQLIFKDQGMGIPKEDQVHLFERFFRGSNVTNIQGTGLGLHIVAKYAELMDGMVTCESNLGQGTTFTITFNKN